jgi:hypothetical protein
MEKIRERNYQLISFKAVTACAACVNNSMKTAILLEHFHQIPIGYQVDTQRLTSYFVKEKSR